MASEDGALRVRAEDVIERWRLQPGKMLVVDTERHELLHDEDVKGPLFGRQPYGRWLEEGEIHLNELPEPDADPRPEPSSLLERQRAFGYTIEDQRILLAPMAQNGKEPDGSMGTDTPLAVLSDRPLARGARHVAQDEPRARAEPLRRDEEALQAGAHRPAGPHSGGTREDQEPRR